MTLFRTRDIIMVMLMLGMAFWTYEVKYAARRDYQQVQRLEQKIDIEKDTAKLLQARWALATDPVRIERLANTYAGDLQLGTIDARQIVKVKDIPERIPDDIEKVIGEDNLLAGNGTENTRPTNLGVDSVTTGSIASQKEANPAEIPLPLKKNTLPKDKANTNLINKKASPQSYSTSNKKPTRGSGL